MPTDMSKSRCSCSFFYYTKACHKCHHCAPCLSVNKDKHSHRVLQWNPSLCDICLARFADIDHCGDLLINTVEAICRIRVKNHQIPLTSIDDVWTDEFTRSTYVPALPSFDLQIFSKRSVKSSSHRSQGMHKYFYLF